MESIRKQIRGKPTSEKSDVFRESEVLSILVKYLKENGWKVKELKEKAKLHFNHSFAFSQNDHTVTPLFVRKIEANYSRGDFLLF